MREGRTERGRRLRGGRVRPPRRGAAAALATALALAVVGAGCGGGDEEEAAGSGSGSEKLSGTVVMMLPNTTTVRFVQHDGPSFVRAMKKYAPDMEVEVMNAEGDAAKQLQQTETALNKEPKAIVLTAAAPNLAAGILNKAQEAGVPLISYEHEAVGGPVTYQVMFDPRKVGEEQGRYAAEALGKGGTKKVARLYGNKGDNYTEQDLAGQNDHLQPLIDSGKLDVVCEANTPGWDPAEAQSIIEQCLTRTQNDLDAIIAMNDGTASGAVAALESQGLKGKVPVYGGQDANLEALQYILAGYQESTVLKPYPVLADAAARLVVSSVTGQAPPKGLVNGRFDNQAAKVPAAFLPVSSVDESNMETVVEAGLYKWQDICTGVAARSQVCRREMGS